MECESDDICVSRSHGACIEVRAFRARVLHGYCKHAACMPHIWGHMHVAHARCILLQMYVVRVLQLRTIGCAFSATDNNPQSEMKANSRTSSPSESSSSASSEAALIHAVASGARTVASHGAKNSVGRMSKSLER